MLLNRSVSETSFLFWYSKFVSLTCNCSWKSSLVELIQHSLPWHLFCIATSNKDTAQTRMMGDADSSGAVGLRFHSLSPSSSQVFSQSQGRELPILIFLESSTEVPVGTVQIKQGLKFQLYFNWLWWKTLTHLHFPRTLKRHLHRMPIFVSSISA